MNKRAAQIRPRSADRPVPGRRWIRRAIWVAVTVTVFLFLEYFDVVLLRLRYQWVGPQPEGFLKHVSSGFREFGQTMGVVVALVLVAAYNPRWKTVVVAVLLAELLAAMAYNPCKMMIARYRPEVAVKKWADQEGKKPVEVPAGRTPADTWIGWRPGNWDAPTQSFPSGHSASAFVVAGVLVWFYPELAVLLWTLAGGCAASRFLDAVHWPSDCWAGAVIGYAAARIALALCARRHRSAPTAPAAESA